MKITLVDDNSNCVKVLIEDSGNGISVTPEKVFRAFRTSKLRGTGLGLHITKKIIESHEGSIHAYNDSALGGARMVISLPKSIQNGAFV